MKIILLKAGSGMIFKRTLICLVLLLSVMQVYSQSDTLAGRTSLSSNISMAYNSSLIYPGLRFGIEIPMYSCELIKGSKSNAPKKVIRDRFLSLNTGWYHHPQFHDNLYITAEWIMRRTKKGGFFMEFSPGTGLSRTFLGGTTYMVDNNGDVHIRKLAGYNYALLTAGAGLGFNFSEKKEIPLSVCYRVNILMMFPYNSTVYLRPVMDLGLIYKPVRFLPVHIRKRIIEK